MRVNERCPNHTRARIKAGINLKNLTLGEFWETADEREKKGIKGRSNRRVIGNLFFCIVFPQVWQEKIHITIKRLSKYHSLKWILTRMSYH